MKYNIIFITEALLHLAEHQLDWAKDRSSNYKIPSPYGIVDELDGDKVLLIPSDLRDDYPCFLFSDSNSFEECIQQNHFPIPRIFMTWREANSALIESFMHIDTAQFVIKELGDISALVSLEDYNYAYSKAMAYVQDDSRQYEQRETMGHYFSLSFLKFLVLQKRCKVEIKTYYEVYNPYHIPFLVSNEIGEIIGRDIVGIFFSLSRGSLESSFSNFYYRCTNLPLREKPFTRRR